MKKKFFAAAFLFCALASFSLGAEERGDAEKRDAIQKYVKRMTLREKIGQLCVMNFRFWADDGAEREGYSGALAADSPARFEPLDKMNASVRKAISEYKIGSVILFAENMADPAAAKEFIRDMNRAALDSENLPLLFFADQEGGNVIRAYDFSTPSAMAIGMSGEAAKENAFLFGAANGALLLDYGINADLAPVCDISSNPQNPVIGIRSFSSDKDRAALLSAAFSEGLASAGVLACAKHFPGHGDTSVDSHLGLPEIKTPLSKWKKNEAVPFKANIDQGIPLVMTAHIQCPGLDKTKIVSRASGKKIAAPATLSKKILTKILRGSLGYKGAVISDAMDMKAICDNWPPEEAFALAVNAGCDLIVNPINVYSKKDLDFLEDFFCKVESFVQDGTLDKKNLDAAASRVLELKEKAGLIQIDGESIRALEQKVVSMPKEKKQEAALLSSAAQAQAARLASSNLNAPLDGRGKKIAAFVPYDEKLEVLKKNFLSRAIDNIEFICYEEKKSAGAADIETAKKADIVLVFTQIGGGAVKDKKRWQAAYPASLAKELKKAGAAGKTIGVSMNLPYDKDVFAKKDGFAWTALCNYTNIGYARAVQALFDE